jgi:hypothetical protein
MSEELNTEVCALTVWENMEAGVVREEFLSKIPEEFRDQYEDIAVKLEDNFSEMLAAIEERVQEVIDSVLRRGDATDLRKKVGLYLKDNDNELNQFVFPTVLGKHEVVVKMIMREIRPHGNNI